MASLIPKHRSIMSQQLALPQPDFARMARNLHELAEDLGLLGNLPALNGAVIAKTLRDVLVRVAEIDRKIIELNEKLALVTGRTNPPIVDNLLASFPSFHVIIRPLTDSRLRKRSPILELGWRVRWVRGDLGQTLH